LTNVGSLGANGNKLIVNGVVSPGVLAAGDYEFIVNGDAQITGTLNVGALILAGPICAPTVQVQNLTSYCLTPGANINLLTGLTQTAGSNTLLNTTITGTLNVTGATTLASLTVTGATVTNGITNTGNIATTTLSTSGLATLNSLAVTNNATIGGTLGVTGLTTTNGIANTGNIATTTLSTTGAATVGGALTVAGVTTLNGATTVNNTLNVTGATTTAGLTNTGAFVENGVSTFNGNINQTSGVTTLLVTNTGNLTVTGTLTQSGGNANIAGAGVNSFGTVAASANTIGSTTSTNLINGTTNTIGTQGAVSTVINNIGNPVQVATSQIPPTTSNVLPVLGNQTYSTSTNNVYSHVVMNGDNTTGNEHILYIGGAPELQVGDHAPIDPMAVANYEVIIQGDLLVTGHLASPSIPWTRSVQATLVADAVDVAPLNGYSEVNVAVAGALMTDLVTVTYINDAGVRGILDASVIAAGTVRVRSSSIMDLSNVVVFVTRP
jgi:hypothetical protein